MLSFVNLQALEEIFPPALQSRSISVLSIAMLPLSGHDSSMMCKPNIGNVGCCGHDASLRIATILFLGNDRLRERVIYMIQVDYRMTPGTKHLHVHSFLLDGCCVVVVVVARTEAWISFAAL